MQDAKKLGASIKLRKKEICEGSRVLTCNSMGVNRHTDINDLGERKHCDYILKICNQRLYLLNFLKKQGLPQLQLQTVSCYPHFSPVICAACMRRLFACGRYRLHSMYVS